MGTSSDDIVYWDRRSGREQQEQVLGGGMVRWLYGTSTGKRASAGLLAHRWFSKLVGAYQSSPLSRSSISRFVRDYRIPLEEYEPGPYRSFNDFFVRGFRPGARSFCADPNVLPAFAEGRYLAYAAVSPDEAFPVKGHDMSPTAILADPERAEAFRGGPVLIARLCPVDYHRFHYPVDGRTLVRYRIAGRLHSVNPIALRCRSNVFRSNERQVSILETQRFGRLAYVEIGAMCVGKIVQTHPDGQPFGRGDEKGYFRFGASSIILFGEPERWLPDADLLRQTAARRETLVRLGEPLARSRLVS